MTKEQAIERLKTKTGILALTVGGEKTIETAIKALEQEPCEDAISRQAAVNIASGFCHPANVVDELAKLPSVNPQEPKTGHWVDHQEGRWVYAKCSECETVHDTQTNYCPNCGARMESEGKE